MTWSQFNVVGVLLLNAVLTVRAASANSHKDKGWEQLTDAVIQYLNKNTSNIVFMLWGAYAQKKGAHINQVSGDNFKHVLCTANQKHCGTDCNVYIQIHYG